MTKRKVTIAATAVVVLFIGYFGLSLIIVNQALVAVVNPLEEHPKDYDLTYEDVSFTPRGSRDITLRGWWFPKDGALGTVIWIHGLDSQRSKRLDLMSDLVDEGFQLLVFDLRGHGGSDLAPMGAGLSEQDDLRGAVDFVTAERGVAPGTVLLLGESFGGAIAIMTGATEPAVTGVYADSAFANLSDVMIDEIADRTPIPHFGASLLKPGIELVAQLAKGIAIEGVSPERSVAEFPYLVGLTHCDADDRLPLDNLIRIRNAAPPGSWLTIYPDCTHAEAYVNFPEQYVRTVTKYFLERLGIQ
jgi:pimeloyl-ACP methyl ester carboxylesterase